MTVPVDLQGTEFVVEELNTADGLDPLVLRLAGRDAPLGGRGSGGAFELAPQVRQAEFHYPGVDEPTRHVQGLKFGPLTVKGNLQDRYAARGHAKAMAEQMDLLARRKRRLRIAWGTWVWRGLLDVAKLSPETTADINYELTFHIDGWDERSGVTIASDAPTTPADLGTVAAAQREILADKLDGLDAMLEGVSAALVYEAALALLGAIDALTEALGALTSLVYADTDVGRVLDLSRSLGLEAARTRGVVGSIPVPDDARVTSAAAWQTARAELLEATWLLEGDALATRLRLEALDRAGVAQEVYVARDGDTLETVARERLGDEGRAGDLARMNGLSGFRLAAGQRLLLPARA